MRSSHIARQGSDLRSCHIDRKHVRAKTGSVAIEQVETRAASANEHQAAVLLFAAAARSRWASKECARGAAAAALVSIASVVANVAGGVAAALILTSALLARRVSWLGRARSEESDALTAEMAASFAASNWRRRARLKPALRVIL